MMKNINLSITPILVACLVISCLLLIPLKVISYGFLPRDDALWHSAKVISGKTWDQILILRKEIKTDTHPGWHAILGLVHKITGCNQDGLVVFSVTGLFFIFCLIPALFLKRPESWLLTLLALSAFNMNFIKRLLLGRPYIVPMSLVLILCYMWPRLRDEKFPFKRTWLITALIALATWIHGSWYLLLLPIACFFLTRQWRLGFRLILAAIMGIFLGSTLTGHPLLYLQQKLQHLASVLGSSSSQRALVGELQPFTGDAMTVLLIAAMLIWRRLRGAWDIKRIDNPVFMLIVLGWALGFLAHRFWADWGIPALCVWLGEEFQEILTSWRKNIPSLSRVALASILAVIVYAAITSDANYRWSDSLTVDYLSLDNPEQAKLLPPPGGIIYNDDMTMFYQIFFKNPKANWRYILGPEPAMMPAEDLEVLRNIQKNFSRDWTYEPWVRKMRPQDRLIIRRPGYEPPGIPGLKWYYAAYKTWVGMLP